MALLASLRSTIAYQTTGSTISTGAIYQTVSGGAPVWSNALVSSMVSIGASTNQVYTTLSQGNFVSSVSTSSWVSSLTGRVSTTTVAMSANAQYQLALSQSSISTSVMFTSTLGTSWSTLSGATGLPNPNETSYTTGAISGNGQYGVLGTSAGQLLVTSTFGQTFSGQNTNVPYVYLPFEGTTADQSGANRTVTATGTFTYVQGNVRTYSAFFNNTAGNNTASFNIAVPWPSAPNFTITGWFNATSFSSGGVTPTIFATYSNSIRATISNAGVLTVTIPSNGTSATFSSGTLSTGTWYNYTFIFQTNGLCSFYLNNALVGSSLTNVGGTGTNALTPIYLGSNGSAQNPFIGYMDDIKIYITAIPFTTLTSSPLPLPAVYLSMDTVPGNGTLSAGTSPATLTVAGPPTQEWYLIGTGAIRLTNSMTGGNATQYIRGTWNTPSSYSVSLWFVLKQSSNSHHQYIFSSGSAVSANLTLLYLQVNNTSLTLQLPGGTINISTPFAIILDSWYNVFFTIQSNGQCVFYVNNVLIGTATSTAATLANGGFGLGASDTGSLVNGFSGILEDVKIYNSVVPFANLFPALIPTPIIYLPCDTVPTNQSSSSGAAPVTLDIIGPPTQAPSYITGTGAINLTNTLGGTPAQYIMGPIMIMPNFTVSLWFNPQKMNNTNNQIIFSMFAMAFQIYIDSVTNKLGVTIPDGRSFGYTLPEGALTSQVITVNTWYSVYVIFQSNGLCSFYLNNTLVGTRMNVGGTGSLLSGIFAVGTYDNNRTNPFSGYIDDLKIYNTAVPFTPMYPSQSFTSTAVSNSGQYMLATMANQGLYMSSNFGRTFSPVTGALLNALWSNAQVSASGQYMLVNAAPIIVQPQLTGLPSSGAALTTPSWQTGGITWIASTSSVFDSTYPVSNGFNNNKNDEWVCAPSRYSIASPGIYSGAVSTNVIGQGAVPGEYVQIQSSTQLQIISYSIAPGLYLRFPNTYTIAGSNDGVTWYLIQSVTMNQNPSGTTSNATPSSSININQSGSQTYTTSGGSATLTCTISSYTTNAYSYFRIIINKPWNNNNTLENNAAGLGEWYINFQAGGQTYSTNYGATWSNQPALYSQQALMTVYNSLTTIQPQQSGLVAASWTQNGLTWTVSASSILAGGYFSYYLFDSNYSNRWVTLSNTYTTSGNSSGIFTTILGGIGSIQGDWVQLQTSVPLVMNSYQFAIGHFNFRMPKTYYIIGSNDETNWYPIQYGSAAGTTTGQYVLVPNTIITNSASTQTFGSTTITTTTYSTTTNAYIYFRLLCMTNNNVTGEYIDIGEWVINFTPPSTTAASITYPSTTLALSESGQYALSAMVSNPVLLAELNFEGTAPAAYADSIGGLTYTPPPLSVLTGITISNTAKVGSNSLSIVNTAGQNGSNSYLSYTLPSFFATLPNAFTISAWINPSSIPGANTSAPISLTGGAGTLCDIYITPAGLIGFEFFTTTNPLQANIVRILTSSSITSNVWTHVAGVIANGIAYLYVNGVLQTSASYTGIICVQTNGLPATTLVVGSVLGLFNQYAGLIDNLRIYNSALTPQQIQNIYANNASSTTLTQISPSFSVSPQQTGLASNSWNQGGVAWTVSASGSLTSPNCPPFGAFNNYIGSSIPYSWCSVNSVYGGTPTGTYNGTVTTTVTNIAQPVPGEWLQLQSSVPLVMHSYTYACGGSLANNGKTYYIVGSTDGQIWYPIQLASMTTNPNTAQFQQCSTYIIVNQSGTQTITGGQVGSGTFTAYPTTTNAYTYFRIIATSVYDNSNFELGEWNIIFTGPTNTSLYNVVSSLTGLSTNTYTSGTIPGVITNSAISNTGQYMALITNNTSGNNVYYSMNYGATFTGLQLGTATLTSCAMSYDGSYITIASGATVYTLNNNSTGFSLALGNQAGQQNQANNAIAIGNYAGYQNQTANSIILNASGSAVNAFAPGFYVAPIASYTASSSQTFSLLGYGTDNQVVQMGITSLYGSNGYIGIGTANPRSQLELNGAMIISNTSTSAILRFVNDSGINYIQSGSILADGSSAPLYFTSIYGANKWMTIAANGNVGIGTTNPLTSLHIRAGFGGAIVSPVLGATTNSSFLLTNESGAYGLNIVGSNTGAIHFQAQYLINGTTTTYPITLNPMGGNVGIGTTNPTNLVTVQNGVLEVNDGTTSGKYGIYSYSGGLNINPRTSSGGYNNIIGLCINSTGKVGIGLTNAETALDVNGTIIIRGANSMTFAYGSVNSIYATTYDGYTPASLNNNLIIKSWHGIAFATHDNSVRVTIDTRTGNANFSGSITAGVFLGDGLPIPFWSTFVNGWYIKNPNTLKITIYGTAISSDWSYIYLNLWDLTGIRTIAYPFDEYNFVSTFQRVPIGFAPPINNANEVKIDSNQGNASKYGITFIIKASYTII